MANLPVLSPLVTRILEISGFSSDLKTRDIQSIFAAWEDERGGFKIKWVDDTKVLIIFAEPSTAKRAYLNILLNHPPALVDENGKKAAIRPYDGDDASIIISSVHHRTRSRSNAANLMGSPGSPGQGGNIQLPPVSIAAPPPHLRGHRSSASNASNAMPNAGSRSTAPSSYKPGHIRHPSGSNPSSLPPKPVAAALYDAANGGPSPAHHLVNAASKAGVPLPTIPIGVGIPARESHKSLEEPMTEQVNNRGGSASLNGASGANGHQSGRVGDAGKRMVAASLGVKPPGLGARKGSDSSTPTIQEDGGKTPDASSPNALASNMEKVSIR